MGNKGVNEVKEHAFFKNETWTFKSIPDCVPPIVCELSGDDDTRNFDDVENDTPNENFPTPKAFAGNHLPFVGFTYSKDYQLLSQTSTVPNDHQPSPIRVRTFDIKTGWRFFGQFDAAIPRYTQNLNLLLCYIHRLDLMKR